MANVLGIDCALDCTRFAASIRSAGVDMIGRYYRWPRSRYRALDFAEASTLSAAGLSIIALWEWTSDRISNFSYLDGFDQGTSAYRQAMRAQQTVNTPIYFAVDADFDHNQISGPISDYFIGVKDAFDQMGRGQSAYLIGVYGSGLTCSWLLAHGRAARSWLACSRGWRGYGFDGWDVKQGTEDLGIASLKPGVNGDYDSDETKPSAGGFRLMSAEMAAS
jgi:hypothetical protein